MAHLVQGLVIMVQPERETARIDKKEGIAIAG